MSAPLSVDEVLQLAVEGFDGVVEMARWGERSLFYNPGRRLPHGVYFVTVKEHDGPNDRASRLDRHGGFRVSVGAGRDMYEDRFRPTPPRPPKGGIVETGHDFTELDTLTPHPVYAWMGWVCLLNPTLDSLAELRPFIVEAHRLAVRKFGQRLRQAERGARSGRSNG